MGDNEQTTVKSSEQEEGEITQNQEDSLLESDTENENNGQHNEQPTNNTTTDDDLITVTEQRLTKNRVLGLLQNSREKTRVQHEQIKTLSETNFKQGGIIRQANEIIKKLRGNEEEFKNRIDTLTEKNILLEKRVDELMNRVEATQTTPENNTPSPDKTPRVFLLNDSNGKRWAATLENLGTISITGKYQASTLKRAIDDFEVIKKTNGFDSAQIILIQLGTNDLQNGANAQTAKTLAEQLLNLLLKENKGVAFNEIPPFRSKTNLDVESLLYNRQLSRLLATSPHVSIVHYRKTIEDLGEDNTFNPQNRNDEVHIEATSKAGQVITQLINDHICSLDLTQTESYANKAAAAPNTQSNPQTQPATKYTKRIQVEKSISGFVIGSNHNNINRIQTKYNITIKILGGKGVSPLMDLCGQKNNVQKAESELNQLIKAGNELRAKTNPQNPNTAQRSRPQFRQPLLNPTNNWQQNPWGNDQWTEGWGQNANQWGDPRSNTRSRSPVNPIPNPNFR